MDQLFDRLESALLGINGFHRLERFGNRTRPNHLHLVPHHVALHHQRVEHLVEGNLVAWHSRQQVEPQPELADVAVALTAHLVKQLGRVEGKVVALELHHLLLEEGDGHRLLVRRGVGRRVVELGQHLVHLVQVHQLVVGDVTAGLVVNLERHVLTIHHQQLLQRQVAEIANHLAKLDEGRGIETSYRPDLVLERGFILVETVLGFLGGGVVSVVDVSLNPGLAVGGVKTGQHLAGFRSEGALLPLHPQDVPDTLGVAAQHVADHLERRTLLRHLGAVGEDHTLQLTGKRRGAFGGGAAGCQLVKLAHQFGSDGVDPVLDAAYNLAVLVLATEAGVEFLAGEALFQGLEEHGVERMVLSVSVLG